MEEEIWMDVVGYNGVYVVSNLGNIKSTDRIIYVKHARTGIVYAQLKHGVNLYHKSINGGYLAVRLFKDKCGRHFLIHRIVSEAFIPNPNNYPCINHIDGDKSNNSVSNLEWCTYSHNLKHAYDNKLTFGLSGESNPGAKITESKAIEIFTCIKSGMKIREIHEALNVPIGVINNMKYNNTWKYLK